MPVMPGYEYADKSHEKTTIDGSYRYGCFDTVRNGKTMTQNQNGWTDDGRRIMIPRFTNWLETVKCGHITRDTDNYCKGCKNV